LELAADALELQVMVFGGALLGRGGEVLRASGESSVGISFNKPAYRQIQRLWLNQGLLLSVVIETREVATLMLVHVAGRIRGREASRLLLAGMLQSLPSSIVEGRPLPPLRQLRFLLADD
jgi:hypothetical protein